MTYGPAHFTVIRCPVAVEVSACVACPLEAAEASLQAWDGVVEQVLGLATDYKHRCQSVRQPSFFFVTWRLETREINSWNN